MNFSQYLTEQLDLDEKRSLNSKIWTDTKHIHPEVKTALNKIAKTFEKFLDVKGLKVIDLLITGSIANYTWHSKSDIDLHLLVDLGEGECTDELKNLFNTKKTLWNLQHNIEVHGFPVELYVQDKDEEHVSSGIYSLKQRKWIVTPKKVHPSINDSYVIRKADEWKRKIDSLIKHKVTNKETIDRLKKRIKDMRQMALDKDGEFAVENLAYKILRNDGYIEKLYDYGIDAEDVVLSVK